MAQEVRKEELTYKNEYYAASLASESLMNVMRELVREGRISGDELSMKVLSMVNRRLQMPQTSELASTLGIDHLDRLMIEERVLDMSGLIAVTPKEVASHG